MRWLRRWPYTLSWTSSWGRSGTLTWSISGATITISYGQSPQGGISWSGSVTGLYGTYAQGSGLLRIINWPKPPDRSYVYVCTVSGSNGSVSGVDGGGSYTVSVSISCTLKLNKQ